MMLKELRSGAAVRWRRFGRVVALLIAVPLAFLAFGVTPAQASNVVNVTIHVPAQVEISPCVPGDVVNLSGDIHIVITTTLASSGNYRVNNHLSSKLKGISITTGTKYVNSTNSDEEWFAGAPFPAVHTHTYDFLLVSKSGTDNYVLHMTMHETVNANGVPTATVDNFSMDCKG
jgi:hypothetical protein